MSVRVSSVLSTGRRPFITLFLGDLLLPRCKEEWIQRGKESLPTFLTMKSALNVFSLKQDPPLGGDRLQAIKQALSLGELI